MATAEKPLVLSSSSESDSDEDIDRAIRSQNQQRYKHPPGDAGHTSSVDETAQEVVEEPGSMPTISSHQDSNKSPLKKSNSSGDILSPNLLNGKLLNAYYDCILIILLLRMRKKITRAFCVRSYKIYFLRVQSTYFKSSKYVFVLAGNWSIKSSLPNKLPWGFFLRFPFLLMKREKKSKPHCYNWYQSIF